MVNGTEAVLLVDDEEIVVGVGKQMLQKLGYTVLIARNGQEAGMSVKKIRTTWILCCWT